ncbi:hypothetical protein B4092_4909 [Bacillus licheniformis]|nr:hypothetical protein B4092_4909 [Bacillus licheniformis]TWK47198.1 hypothetical protein CHCC20345_4160 [Bacillus licheniformis]
MEVATKTKQKKNSNHKKTVTLTKKVHHQYLKRNQVTFLN